MLANNIGVLDTSIFCNRVAVATSGSTEVLPPNPRRMAFMISGSTEDVSFSWQPGMTLNKAPINLFADLPYTVLMSIWLIGTAIQQPLYGIAGGGGVTIEVAEMLYNGPGGIPELMGMM